MKHIIRLLVCFALFIIPCFAQDWQKIIPLKTKCEDLKKILGVKECSYPVSNYKFEKFSVNIQFSMKNDGWNVSRETVVDVTISFRQLIRLKDFETDFTDYKITPQSDYPALTYTNDKKGISFETQNPEGNDEYITNISLYPPKTKNKRD